METNKTQTEIINNERFEVTEKFKEDVIKIIEDLPYEKVYLIHKLISKTEPLYIQEINYILGELSKEPFKKVKDFFDTIMNNQEVYMKKV
jgi:hypothetical protein